MIIALKGALCSGKATLALYLQKEFGFQIVDLYKVFASEVGLELNHEIVEKFFSGKESF